MINQRTIGNNVIKFEFDYFTGSQHTYVNGSNSSGHLFFLGYDDNKINDALVTFIFRPSTGIIEAYSNDYSHEVAYRLNNDSSIAPILPFNTWIKFIVYLDYDNKKVYFETPYFNAVTVGDFLSKNSSTNLIQDFKPVSLTLLIGTKYVTSTHQLVNKYDNIKITGLKEVPLEVISANVYSFLSESFNLYPNPATNVVNITNSDNMFVNQVQVYDLSGKLINTQNFTNEAEIQLNVEILKSGTYLLHLQTDQGIAVKKLIKK